MGVKQENKKNYKKGLNYWKEEKGSPSILFFFIIIILLPYKITWLTPPIALFYSNIQIYQFYRRKKNNYKENCKNMLFIIKQ